MDKCGAEIEPAYIAFPIGVATGWTILGKYTALELANLRPLRLLTESLTVDTVGDEIEYRALCALIPKPQEIQELKNSGRLPHPLLVAIKNDNFTPLYGVRGRWTLGYTAFEENLLAAQTIANARSKYDHIATTSNWCAEALRSHGLTQVTTVIQGYDPQLYHPVSQPRSLFADRFVVFSGGKFEFRKGQDLVIRAYKVLQDKHPDTMLITSWMNLWPESAISMAKSQFISYSPIDKDHVTSMNRLITDNGIDATRTIHLSLRPHGMMAKVYHSTDVGLFPNRCEGGTNMVLMEYMACGKPAIASYFSGQRDILTRQNCLPLDSARMVNLDRAGHYIASWDEPSLDQIVAHLEFAYENRGHLRAIGAQAGTDMTRFTWRRTAEQFHQMIQSAARC